MVVAKNSFLLHNSMRLFGFLSASTVTGIILATVAFRFLASPGEKRRQQEIQQLTDQYEVLQKHLVDANNQIAELEDRDNNIYRAVFESAPLPDSIRYGKSYTEMTRQKYAYAYLFSKPWVLKKLPRRRVLMVRPIKNVHFPRANCPDLRR